LCQKKIKKTKHVPHNQTMIHKDLENTLSFVKKLQQIIESHCDGVATAELQLQLCFTLLLRVQQNGLKIANSLIKSIFNFLMKKK